MTTLLFALVIVLFAGGVSGLAGFGFALTSVPLLLLLYDPPTVVALSNSLALASLTFVVSGHMPAIIRPALRGMLIGAGVGLVAGFVLLRGLNDDAIKLLASVVVIAFAAVLARGWVPPAAHHPGAAILAGFGSGALNAATGLSGPPVVMLLSARGLSPLNFRVTLASYFIVIDIITLAALGLLGLLRWEHLILFIVLAPAAAIGTLTGRRISRHVPAESFRRITLILLVATGMIGGATAISGLIH